jgi:serine/threonine-protein kinase
VIVDTLLNNRYDISDSGEPPIDSGGMAIIYAGTDMETGQDIAAKTLLPVYQGDSQLRARFRHEASVLRAVQHPHVVRLIDVVDGRRGSWIIMERLEGANLREMLKERDERNEGPFNPSTVGKWLIQVCAALGHIHELGYVHLDVTPQNLFLTTHGDVKLIDFGITQQANTEVQRDGDKLRGTATYISPEHGSGRIVTPRSDVYSLGCVVFELLTGRKVFSEHGDLSNDATINIRQGHAPELPTHIAPDLNLPAWVDRVAGRALIPTPEERYPDVTSFAQEFNAAANPPLFRFSWPKREPGRETGTNRVSPATQQAVPHRIEPELVLPERTPREPSRVRRWAQREFRNARKAVAVFALLLTLVLGAPLVGGSTMLDWLLGAVPGSTTVVVDGNWNLRAAPNPEAEIRTVLMQDTEVRITGTPEVVDDGLWWPVSAEVNGEGFDGWAHNDGLKRTWLMDRAAGWELFRTSLSNRRDSVTGLLPG